MSAQSFSSKQEDLVSLYIHIPFCIKRCNYCDFNTYANRIELISLYVTALCNEINQLGKICNNKVHTIYFGGGTPSFLPVEKYSIIMNDLRRNFKLTSDLEISMEVNPGILFPGFLEEIYSLGFNRLSVGLQSAIPEELAYLGRLHTPLDVIETIRGARLAGFRNISLDLMFGLPGQSLKSWQESLDFALGLHPTHLSLYSLTYEKGTRLDKWRHKGLLPNSSEDLGAELYEMAITCLRGNNYLHYEISNWALLNVQRESEYICRHNVQYWLNRPYIGIGAGAHSFFGGYRWANLKTIPAYIQTFSGKEQAEKAFANRKKMPLSQRTQMQETMWLGLRLLEQGVSNADFKNRFGISIQDAYNQEINELLKLELVTWKGREKDYLCLTERGCLLGNQVFLYFVD